ncbi:MAG: 50S ribosomal protein L6 [Thermogutta sp.]|uniref:50S ribosomal protein L6 n=1 Tax=Thermogutta sp. TaxID=1962930 RepID=UPI0019A55726|nr:50S ribosomal protein L6 [Thermogutta sp.]MBC7351238.1 50S ribosomal protein L6 [Thermogutta sp.]GIX02327.1 MAG: 50S ribosomal protein L6 [Thermogutta sp.]
MSRIGKRPVPIPQGVKVTVEGRLITVEGPKGRLQWEHRPEVQVTVQEQPHQVVVQRVQETRLARALHGLTRALVNNMIVGVTQGYEKRLEIVGVGYLAAVQGRTLQLRVGYANELQVPIPDGLEVTCPDQQHIVIRGIDKQKVGNFAASVRALRKPDPYKGKGIRYQGEHIRMKEGKVSAK